MQWLARYATRVAVRRVVYVLVIALLAWIGIGRAQAADCRSSSDHCSISEAIASCNSSAGMMDRPATCVRDEHTPTTGTFTCRVSWSSGNYTCGYYGENFADPRIFGAGNQFVYDSGCPAGTEWNDSTGTCFNPEECLSKPPLGGTFHSGSTIASSMCSGGCSFAPAPGENDVAISLDGGSTWVTVGGGWVPTGEACAVGEPPAQLMNDGQECLDVDGQSVCVKPDGRHCYEASTGRQICWQPGETGEKTDGETLQKTNAGDQPIPPNMQLPNGDTLEQSDPPINTTTQTGDRTINTTTTNYNTQHGTNADGDDGSNDSGEPSDGSGGGGEGDGEDGSASGGETCAAPPVCTGNALTCYAINQEWFNACDSSGEGMSALDALTTQALNESYGEDGPDWTGELGSDGEGDLDTFRRVEQITGAELDDSGFLGGGQCPSFPVPDVAGTALNIDFSIICELLENVSHLVMAAAYFLAFRIIAGGGRK